MKENKLKNINDYADKLNDDDLPRVFERFCAEKIIPRIHSEKYYPEVEEMLTKYHDGGIDICYENILCQCKYTIISSNDDVDVITTKIIHFINTNFKTHTHSEQTIFVYLFCQTINAQMRKRWDKNIEAAKLVDSSNRISSKIFNIDEINTIYHNPMQNASINLAISTRNSNGYDTCNDERENSYEQHGGIAHLYSGGGIKVGMASISASNFMNALKGWANNDLSFLKNNYRNLFDENVRSYIDSANSVNKKIKETITENANLFCLRNNGIVILCKSYKNGFSHIESNKAVTAEIPRNHYSNSNNNRWDDTKLEKGGMNRAIIIDGAQIINGAQTIGTICSYYFKNISNDDELIKLSHVGVLSANLRNF